MPTDSQRNRQQTEQKLLQAVDALVEKKGYEALGINAISAQAGVSKMLIYRYFTSLEGLITAYIRQHDFWINIALPRPEKSALRKFLRSLYRGQIRSMRENYALRRLYRWELTSQNVFVEELRRQRELKGLQLIEWASKASGRPHKEVAFLASLLSSSICHLSIFEENCNHYNGIPLQEDAGWKEIEKGIFRLIDLWLTQIK